MKGSVIFLQCENKLLSYGRFTQNEAVVVVLNNDYTERMVDLKVARLGIPNYSTLKRVIQTNEEGYTLKEETVQVQNNLLTVTLPDISATVYIYKEN